MIINILQNLFSMESKTASHGRQAVVAPDDSKKSATVNSNQNPITPSPAATVSLVQPKNQDIDLDQEVMLLARKYGPLTSGVRIELSLQEALRLFPRTRKRSDAYKPLMKKVKEYGAELIIIGRRKNE